MRFFKYIHLMYANDIKFVERTIVMLRDDQNRFNYSDHAFIVPGESVYQALQKYDNVFLDNSGSNLLKKYSSFCDLLIMHNSPDLKQLVLTPYKIRKKVVYRYWGGSRLTNYSFEVKDLWAYIRKKAAVIIFKKIMHSFRAIGVANLTDVIDLRDFLDKDAKVYYLGYQTSSDSAYIEALKREKTSDDNNYRLRVLLGHRGKEEGNHIYILNILQQRFGDFIDIYIPLSYGDKDYIAGVVDYVRAKKYNNVFILTKFMDYQKYAEFLSTVDIGVFDGVTSYALGNISLLLYFGKTLYLDKNGVIANACDAEGLPYNDTHDLCTMSIREFTELYEYRIDPNKQSLPFRTYETVANDWKRMFNDLS